MNTENSRHRLRSRRCRSPAFRWANKVLANVKNTLVATRVVGAKHLPRYLGAFAWRFNHRLGLKTIQERLALAATPPRRCPTGSSHWLRLAGKQETGFTFSQ